MEIVVPVKQVAVLDEEFELLDDRPGVDPDALDWELNEWDEFSLETALQLRAGGGEGEGMVFSVGDEQAEEGLRACLAKGADRAQRIWDDSLDGADPLAVARVLAAAVERESPDLVLCGVQSSDGVHSATGVALAAHLGLSRVAVVKALDYDAGSRSATVERGLEGGPGERAGVGHGRTRAGGRPGGAAASRVAGAVHDPDRNQRASLREPARDQAGQGEAARRARPGQPGARR